SDPSAQIPTDAAGQSAFLDRYKRTFDNGARQVQAATDSATQLIFYDAYVSISTYLSTRVSSPTDYKSALIRLLGDKFKSLS
ncbi:hypothetical protein U2062_15290, partial [Listeria monocytogenes]